MAERDNSVVVDISRCMRELQVELEIIQVPLSTFCRCPETGFEKPWAGSAFDGSKLPITRLLDNHREGGLAGRRLLRITY